MRLWHAITLVVCWMAAFVLFDLANIYDRAVFTLIGFGLLFGSVTLVVVHYRLNTGKPLIPRGWRKP